MSSFLYPSLEPIRTDLREDDGNVMSELIMTVSETWAEADRADERSVTDNGDRLDRAAAVVLERIARGGRILAIGNGGSACDADRLVRLLLGVVPARSLLDPAVLSALANDVGAARVFARQVETFAAACDVVVAFSTSGVSPNIIGALKAARQAGAATIAFAGYDGAGLAHSPDVDVCLRVASESVHRIQETQGALCDALVARLRDGDITKASTVKAAP